MSSVFSSRTICSLASVLALACCFPAAYAQEPAPGNAPGQATQPAAAAAAIAAANENMVLRIGGGDLVEVSIYGVPELTTKGRVSSTGELYLPLIGAVQIAKLPAEDAQALIESKYVAGGFLKNPHVTVNVLEYVTQGASLFGEVMRPGIYPVLGSRRLFDIVSAAGGFSPAAGRNVTITRRDQPQKPILVTFSTEPERAAEANVEIYPGDTILVAKAPLIYVVGEVGKPSGILMDNKGMTVLKALALGGGPTRAANLNGSKLIRRTASGTQEIPLQLKLILAAKAKDIELQPEDVLFVPGKHTAAIQAILQTLTGLAIRAPF